MKKKECVLNFPSSDVYDRCEATIRNNNYDDDEIAMSRFTVETTKTINAPRIKECFLNLECELLWEKEQFEESRETTVCLRVKHTATDGEYCDEEKKVIW